MLAMIGVDAHRFLVFSDLTCHLKDAGIGSIGSSHREASVSTGKNTRVVLVPCCT